MKKFLSIMVLVLTGYFINAQNLDNDEVPEKVKSEFQEEFPDVSMDDVDWEREDFQYTAEFEHEGMEHEVIIDKAGELVSSKSEMDAEKLPEEVKEGIKDNNLTIDEEETARHYKNQESTLYKIEAETEEEEEVEAFFDEDGEIVEKIES
ncbi:PepSY-like domain-containing protein [Cytophagaceae bacterium ABcell3]|nr:PepSY-like domain-containing protein [Cytophagaceae bacterium ABcell3]